MECFKWGLIGHSIRNVKDVGAEGDFNFGAWFKRFQRSGILLCCLEIILMMFW